MATVLPALCFLVVNAATLSTSSVPGTGRQEVLLTLDGPAAIHLSARSAAGTSCTIIDRVPADADTLVIVIDDLHLLSDGRSAADKSQQRECLLGACPDRVL